MKKISIAISTGLLSCFFAQAQVAPATKKAKATTITRDTIPPANKQPVIKPDTTTIFPVNPNYPNNTYPNPGTTIPPATTPNPGGITPPPQGTGTSQGGTGGANPNGY